MSQTVEPDAWVTVAYRLYDEAGQLVDEVGEDDPLGFVFGCAQVLPALERDLEGAKAGDRRTVEAGPGDAFGERDEGALLEVDRDDFPGGEAAKVGDEIVASGPDGVEVAHRVVEVTDDAVLVDLNHPLAGQRVRFEIEVCEVRAATDAELDAAQAAVDELIVGEGAIVYGSQPGDELPGDASGGADAPNEHLVQLRSPSRTSDEEQR
jgi:FKBP-type peptidyl-prolyl cis-trans isomerase SlyD